MTDFLVIGDRIVDVLAGGASQQAAETMGEEKRAIDGTLRSSVYAFKRAYRFSLVPMDPADYTSFETYIFDGGFQACSGAAIVAGTYSVQIAQSDYLMDGEPDRIKRTVDIVLRQV